MESGAADAAGGSSSVEGGISESSNLLTASVRAFANWPPLIAFSPVCFAPSAMPFTCCFHLPPFPAVPSAVDAPCHSRPAASGANPTAIGLVCATPPANNFLQKPTQPVHECPAYVHAGWSNVGGSAGSGGSCTSAAGGGRGGGSPLLTADHTNANAEQPGLSVAHLHAEHCAERCCLMALLIFLLLFPRFLLGFFSSLILPLIFLAFQIPPKSMPSSKSRLSPQAQLH
jgi:hypothetical protein